MDESLTFNETCTDTKFLVSREVKYMARTSISVVLHVVYLMWAYFKLLRLYTNVWVEPINIGTLVVNMLNICGQTP